MVNGWTVSKFEEMWFFYVIQWKLEKQKIKTSGKSETKWVGSFQRKLDHKMCYDGKEFVNLFLP